MIRIAHPTYPWSSRLQRQRGVGHRFGHAFGRRRAALLLAVEPCAGQYQLSRPNTFGGVASDSVVRAGPGFVA